MATDQKKRTLEYGLACLRTCANNCFIALPFVANFAAGAIAGISEILTFYPLGEIQQSCAVTGLTEFSTLYADVVREYVFLGIVRTL